MEDGHSERAQWHSALVSWADLLKHDRGAHGEQTEPIDESVDVVYRRLLGDIERLSEWVRDEIASSFKRSSR